ncbi:MAG: triosephosphate isomerase 1 [Rhodomicrobium sp.]|nr:MAG: triosephosphate isomerase 1 [Rhodomicrobium sp.]
MIKPLVAGNWKMNGTSQSVQEIKALDEKARAANAAEKCDILICPPSTLLVAFSHILKDSPIKLGGQDCHANATGAHTGDISAEMLADSGADYVIVGHSERRMDHKERDCDVKAKAEAGWRAGLKVILCVGELIGERSADLTLKVIERQLKNSLPEGATADNLIIAYEPVWAIGTGLTPTVSDVAEVHDFMRKTLIDLLGDQIGGNMKLLYGGSVKPGNAKELMAASNVNGALVGGASLKADDFAGIIAAYE